MKKVYSVPRRAFVGMSGGVDSSVSAALLKKAGYEVIGVFIRVWEPAGFVCSWREERRWARRVAAHLDIPLLTLDLSREYKRKVVDYFISEYKAGRTPNPDVMCNKHIKFGVFYDWAITHGADFVATGHYSQIGKNLEVKPREATQSFNLQVSADQDKDQTYFLWNLKTEQLPKILFPVGKYTKTEVRALARKFKLPTSEKKDSQGLCFVGKIDFKDFLKREIKEKRGDVINERGEVIGHHDGATFFTLGERHGFEITTKTPDDKPYYIIAKDVKKNTLTVSTQKYQGESLISEVKIEKTNWIGNQCPENSPLKASQGLSSGHNLLARVRYRQALQKCQITKLDLKTGGAIITFATPQLAVPGQSLVLYDK
ncbi:MAG TPA: tRNA 2-thiouridine(34) synthase MnmA, partial [Candidatus Paceibacterota bacterium]|nr:tRNA 2-thiouridine(34) synthase MnmA [Candidatus Paceibacterota bacterium]